MRERVGLTALAGYLPALTKDPRATWTGVFGYHGIALQTTASVPVWGLRILFFSLIAPLGKWPPALQRPVEFVVENSWQIAIVLLLSVAWLRRSRRSVRGLCATIPGTYLMIYGVSDN